MKISFLAKSLVNEWTFMDKILSQVHFGIPTFFHYLSSPMDIASATWASIILNIFHSAAFVLVVKSLDIVLINKCFRKCVLIQ